MTSPPGRSASRAGPMARSKAGTPLGQSSDRCRAVKVCVCAAAAGGRRHRPRCDVCDGRHQFAVGQLVISGSVRVIDKPPSRLVSSPAVGRAAADRPSAAPGRLQRHPQLQSNDNQISTSELGSVQPCGGRAGGGSICPRRPHSGAPGWRSSAPVAAVCPRGLLTHKCTASLIDPTRTREDRIYG